MSNNSDHGVILYLNGTATGSLVKLNAPEVENPTVASTNHDSVGAEVVSSRLPRVGEMVLTVSMDSTQTTSYYGYVTAGSMLSWAIKFPQQSGSLVFSGILSKFKPNDSDADSPNLLTADFTVTPSGSAAYI